MKNRLAIKGKELAKFVDEHGRLTDCHISSFKLTALRGVRSYSDDSKISFITLLPNPWKWKKYHNQLNLFSINCYHRFLGKKIIGKLNEMGTGIYAWTINDTNSIRKALNKPITGILTDVPLKALDLLTKSNNFSN